MGGSMRSASSAKARVIGVCLCALLFTAGGLAAAVRQSAPTEAEYGPLMTEIRFTVGDAELHVDSRYWPETREDLDKLVPMFEQVEAFWTARGTDDAVGFAQQALAALNDLGDAAVGQNLASARGDHRSTGHLPVLSRESSGANRRRLPDQVGLLSGPCHEYGMHRRPNAAVFVHGPPRSRVRQTFSLQRSLRCGNLSVVGT